MPAPSLRPGSAAHARGEYTRADVRRLLRVTERQLRSWERQGLIPPGEAFTFRDLLALRALQKLREGRIAPRQIALAIASLKQKLVGVTEPLNQLRLLSDGRTIRVQVAGQRMEAITGQLLFDFDASEIPAVHEMAKTEHQMPELPTRSEEHDAEEWFQRGLALEETGAPPDQAREAYLEAIAINPNAAGALVNLGTIAFRSRQHAEAATYYQRAIAADPRYPLAHFNLGNVFDEMGKTERARAHYENAVALNPEYADAHFNLALIAERNGDNLRALKHWGAYLKIDNASQWASQARKQVERLRKLHVVE